MDRLKMGPLHLNYFLGHWGWGINIDEAWGKSPIALNKSAFLSKCNSSTSSMSGCWQKNCFIILFHQHILLLLKCLSWERSQHGEQATLVLSVKARIPHTGSRPSLVWVMYKYKPVLTDTQSQTGLRRPSEARKQNQPLTGHYHCQLCHWGNWKTTGVWCNPPPHYRQVHT